MNSDLMTGVHEPLSLPFSAMPDDDKRMDHRAEKYKGRAKEFAVLLKDRDPVNILGTGSSARAEKIVELLLQSRSCRDFRAPQSSSPVPARERASFTGYQLAILQISS
jgi:hypothetical protein